MRVRQQGAGEESGGRTDRRGKGKEKVDEAEKSELEGQEVLSEGEDSRRGGGQK